MVKKIRGKKKKNIYIYIYKGFLCPVSIETCFKKLLNFFLASNYYFLIFFIVLMRLYSKYFFKKN